MQTCSIYEAKTHFSKLINLVEHNEEILISRNGNIVAKIIPFHEQKSGKRQFGMLRGKIKIHEDFDAPLPDEILNAFYLGKI